MTAEMLMLIGGLSAFILTIHWVRARQIREKYAVYWVLMASLVLLIGLFPRSIMWFAEAAHLSYAVAILFIALTVIYIFAFSVTVALSTQYNRNVRLTQQIALLEERVRQLESRLTATPERDRA